MDYLARSLDNTHIGNTLITGDLDVLGAFEIGGVEIGEDLQVDGKLTVLGASELRAGLNMNNTNITNVFNFSSSGQITAASASITSVSVGSLSSTGNVSATGITVAGTISASQTITAQSTTDSTGIETGSFQCLGGASITKKLYVGTDLSVGGVLDTVGNLDVGGVATIDGNLMPNVNAAYNIGSNNFKWLDLHMFGTATIGGDVNATGAITGASCTTTEQTPTNWTMAVNSDVGTSIITNNSVQVSYLGKWVFLTGTIEFEKGSMSGAIYFTLPKHSAADSNGSMTSQDNIASGAHVTPRINSGNGYFELYDQTKAAPIDTGDFVVPANPIEIKFSIMYVSV